MKIRVWTMCITMMVLLGITGSTWAYSMQAGFLYEGFDLDMGAMEYDRTVLVVQMGESVDELLRPNRSPLADFSPAVDISFDFDPGLPQFVDVVLHGGVKLAVIQDLAFDANYTMFDSLTFTDSLYSVSVAQNDLLLAWTADDRYFKVGNWFRNEWDIAFDVLEVSTVPEPSTVLLMGLGILGILKLRRRSKNVIMLLIVGLLIGVMGAGELSAQPAADTITVKKAGAGSGTVLIGDLECGAGCTEMTVPYVEHRSLALTHY